MANISNLLLTNLTNYTSSNYTENTTELSNATADNKDYTYYLQLSGEIVIAILSILTNGAVLLAIFTYPSLQTVTNYFVASLSTADLFVGLIGIPCVLAAMHRMPENFSGCLTVNTMIIILTQISIFGLLVIAIERFFAIRYPFEYSRICTPKRAVIVIAITWVLSILVTLLPSFAWNLNKKEFFVKHCDFTQIIDMKFMVYFNFFGCVLAPLVVMTAIYGYIFRVVIKQLRSIAASQMQSSGRKKIMKQNETIAVTASVNDWEQKTLENTKIENGDKDQKDNGQEDIPTNTIILDPYKLEKTKELSATLILQSKEIAHALYDVNTENSNDNNDTKYFHNAVRKVNFQENNDDAHSNNNEPELVKGKKEEIINIINKYRKFGSRFQSKGEDKKQSNSNWAKDIKAAKWFAVVLFCFTVSWLPLHILNCMLVINGHLYPELIPYAVLLSHLNSAINPILYAFGNSKFEAALRKLLGLKNKSSLETGSVSHKE